MQFEDWMNWDNQGEWHLDHVRPCSSFELLDSEQASLCHNWRNFQPLSAEENMKKRDDYDLEAELVWKDRMRDLGYEGNLFLMFSDEQTDLKT